MAPEPLTVIVDGIAVRVAPGTTLLEAARAAGAEVPTLCFDDRLAPFGACRVCLVGLDGGERPVASCTTLCCDGAVVDTRDPTARRVAGAVVELVLSELPAAPAAHTELAAVARSFGLDPEAGPDAARWTGATHARALDDRHPYLVLQHELCISCGRCVRACDEVQGAFALTATGRGFEANVTAGLMGESFQEFSCVSCGACADTCPTDAITEHLLIDLAPKGAA
ncbi:2Fe-2S iron-sulfur cluster-binding protein [Paraconexibacter antarcticus]|uniref:2Fe-2S iron-sulfur cluster-binding protein n=1 Tax=Paraconexibacter antarcticus TaxID=2949664 RepID=A0ABY5DPE1_9ACTN|nr:2Fe-2S iron-sulfur cluster-binding protein [Paraconexibacter antarcticus]UTI63536.1 2Fe-2S iron-sulfur cluster-binding protein [Paraconexibacter antarcticus]